MDAILNSVQALRLRMQNSLGRLAWVVKNWALSLAVLVLGLTFFTHYLPDALSSKTLHDVVILEATQNSGNYAVKMQDDSGTVISARIAQQYSDLQFSAGRTFTQAATIAEHNRKVEQKLMEGDLQRVTVRLSGFGIGDASRAPNLTQINPPLPSFLYNVLGWLVYAAYWLIPLVALPKLAAAFIRKRSYLTGGAAGVIVLAYVLDWFYI